MPVLIKVTAKDGIQPGQMKNFFKEGKSVGIANVGGKLYAFEDSCPHMGARLSNGSLVGSVITCPEHSSKFDVTTGKALAVSDNPLVIHEVKIEGDDIYIII
jgi:3-phenylpropionate/trans-cinnamate dioxygenase ferredoxin subunit